MTDSTTSTSPDKSLAKTLFTVRYVIPAVLALVGLVSLFVLSSPLAVEAWALFTGAGLSVLLLNVLFRLGIQGDLERDREDAARAYFDEHGTWPDEEKRPAGRRWSLPEGVVMPESESDPRTRA
jgi:xanthosine utilization system XapX-like protein